MNNKDIELIEQYSENLGKLYYRFCEQHINKDSVDEIINNSMVISILNSYGNFSDFNSILKAIKKKTKIDTASFVKEPKRFSNYSFLKGFNENSEKITDKGEYVDLINRLSFREFNIAKITRSNNELLSTSPENQYEKSNKWEILDSILFPNLIITFDKKYLFLIYPFCPCIKDMIKNICDDTKIKENDLIQFISNNRYKISSEYLANPEKDLEICYRLQAVYMLKDINFDSTLIHFNDKYQLVDFQLKN